MIIVKRTLLLGIFICLTFSLKSQPFPTLTVKHSFNRDLDSIFYKRNVTWFIPGYILYAQQDFSVDSGKTYIAPGLFGRRLRKNLVNDQSIRANIAGFGIVRGLGLAQMVGSTYFIGKHIQWLANNNILDPRNTAMPKAPPDIWYGIAVFFTGELTYHILSKHFIKKALMKNHQKKKLVY